MADYLVILDSETNPNAPLRSSLFKRMVANPIAITEGATGAPKIKYRALDTLNLGGVTMVGSGFAGWTGIGDVSRLLIFVSGPGAAENMRFQFTADNGATWGSILFMVGAPSIIASAPAIIVLNLITGDYESLGGPRRTGTFAVPANCNGVRLAGVAVGGQAQAIAIGGR